MAIYEMKCEKCGEILEILAKDKPQPVRCPKCLHKMKRVWSPYTFHFTEPMLR